MSLTSREVWWTIFRGALRTNSWLQATPESVVWWVERWHLFPISLSPWISSPAFITSSSSVPASNQTTCSSICLRDTLSPCLPEITEEYSSLQEIKRGNCSMSPGLWKEQNYHTTVIKCSVSFFLLLPSKDQPSSCSQHLFLWLKRSETTIYRDLGEYFGDLTLGMLAYSHTVFLCCSLSWWVTGPTQNTYSWGNHLGLLLYQQAENHFPQLLLNIQIYSKSRN